MLILSIVGNAGIVQAETMAEGEEAVDIQVEPGAPVPVEAFDTDITEIETIEKTDGEEKVSEEQKAAEGRSYEKKLFRDNGWDGSEPRPGTELRDGDTVSFSDQLIIKYSFELSPYNIEAIQNHGNKVYPLTCPDGLKWVEDAKDKDIEFTNEDGQKIKFATLSQKEAGASITFINDLNMKAADGIEDIYIYLGCHLDQGKLGEPEEPEEHTIVVSLDNQITVRIAENQPRDSKLTGKTGTYQNGTFTWEVTYQPGKKEKTLPLTFVDEFDSTYHDYKDDSFKIRKSDGSEISDDSQKLIVEKNEGKTKLSYQIPQELSGGKEPITITYDTTLTDEGLTSASSRNVTNTAWLMDNQAQKVGEPITGDAVFEKVNWLQKENVGGLQETDGRKYLKWKVTVQTNGKELNELVLHDHLKTGRDFAKFNLDTVNITAYKNGGSTDETGSHNMELNPSNGGFDLTFDTSNLADRYEVTYETEIDEEYFHNSQNSQFDNQASLDYAWTLDNGNKFQPASPEVSVPVGVDGSIITKAGAGYDPSAHTITWRVAVNPRQLNLSEITITDKPGDFGQTYAADSFSMEGDAVQAESVTEDNGTLTIQFRNTGTETFAYTFQTTVNDPKDYGYNLPNKAYHNTVDANAVLKNADGPKNRTARAAGTQNIRSNVLKKEAEGYRYNDHTIGWCLTVNENKMPMKSEDSILLEDTLLPGLTYVDGSMEVLKENGDKEDRVTLKTEGQKLTFQFDKDEELTDTLIIRFRTKVDVEAIEDFKASKSVGISNEAVLKRADGYEDLSVEAEQQIANQLLDKKGTYHKEEGTITYRVNLNPHRIALKDTIVRDELPAGLQLDKDTIQLYRAAVDKDGNFIQDTKVDLTNRLQVNVLERWFEIRLPEENSAYVLEYSTDVTGRSQTSFTNQISLKGTVSGDAGQGGANTGLGVGGGGGGGSSSPKVNLTLTKGDAVRPGVTLQGAVFRISDEDGPVNEVTTDADGKAVFRYLKRGKTYTIEEMTPPTGYQGMEKPIKVFISLDKEETPKEYAYPEVITNQPVTGDLSFVKKNDFGRTLAGAEFTLTDRTPGSNWNQNAVSGADGKVTFTDIPYGTYTLREVKAPEQHTLSDKTYQVTVDQDGKAVLADTSAPSEVLTEIINESEKASIMIKKIDRESRKALAGVAFSLYNSERTWITTKSTGADGTVTFADLEVGGKYRIQEHVPAGYAAEKEIQEVTLTKDGLQLTWENYRAAEVALTIRNAWNNMPVSGVEMGLWRKSPGMDWENIRNTTPYKTVRSDADGVLRFGNLPEGEYWLYMRNAPEGYQPDDRLMAVHVKFGGDGQPVVQITDAETGAEITDNIVNLVPQQPEPAPPEEPAPEETKKPEEPDPEETKKPEEPAPEETKKPAPEETKKPAPEETKKPDPEETKKPAPEKTGMPEKSTVNSGWTVKPGGVTAQPETADKDSNPISVDEAHSPKTGDSTPLGWFVVLTLLSGGGIIITILCRISGKKQEENP